jgi:hypothetical protein
MTQKCQTADLREFEFSAHTLLPMQSTTPLDRPTNWMLTNFGRT